MIWSAGAVLATLFVLVSLAPPRARGWIWVVIIAAAVVPWTDLQNHSHWSRVGWIPFFSPPVRLRDIVLNVLLYAPFGWFFRRGSRTGAQIGPVVVIGAALCLSIGTEASQSYSHSRFPSATDVATNLIGAALGWSAAARARPPEDTVAMEMETDAGTETPDDDELQRDES